MKVRAGFVSNSSSSSFICDVCGGSESGWDASLEGVGMVECKGGHTFHESCSSDEPGLEKYLSASDEDWEADSRDHVPSELCPLCSMDDVEDSDMILYLLKKIGSSRADIIKEIQSRFFTYDKFCKHLKDKPK